LGLEKFRESEDHDHGHRARVTSPPKAIER
jgi:hypothetical protein